MGLPEDTIAALATPAGTSALAVVRITGPDAARLTTEIFRTTPVPRRVSRGEYRERAGAFLDDVLFTFFAGPRSYTGEDVLEISGHGNPWIAQRVLEDLYARGCRPAEPGEFTRRAWLNGRMDLSQAEAVMDLIHARSERALAAAHRLLGGAMGRELQSLTEGIVRSLALVEAYIDFPEEDLPAEDLTGLRRSLQAAADGVGRLLATRHYGDLLRDGIKIVIVGEPNAGKSSLLNRLVGRDRALVSPDPGTTRDFIEERIILGPHCLRLIDTAGLNPAPAPLEAQGMAKTRECIETSDMVLLVLDATRPTPPLLAEIRGQFDPLRTLVVRNKIDLPAAGSAGPGEWPGIPVSALTGAGFDELAAAVIETADHLLPAEGSDDIAINARHAHALTLAQDCMCQALTKLDTGAESVLLASDLRGALSALGEIAGKIDNERMLDLLFASFCIGK